ncbi:MAG: M48 family metalloprotease [Candidatus Aminicenantes bacterium]|nr:M48 family metalloprotease [Candidatus Aminicenantes bacterium]NIQ68357.1 M48 family metalloprotease [Candidatus Aminicenantes bacterium]NIT24400.1 M48 family metalloprotease [Candidatus Aminicenantes bacterium]
MIIANFIFFFIAILIFAMAPVSTAREFSPALSLYGIIIFLLGFWHYNRYKFMKLRAIVKSETISMNEAKKSFFNTINFHTIIAIFLFAAEIYVFDLKKLLVQIPDLGGITSFLNAAGLAVFILHLTFIWYWVYKAVGDTIAIGKSPGDYVRSNIKFNLVIVIPWLSLLLIHDFLVMLIPSLMEKLEGSFLFNTGYFGSFIVIFLIVAPAFITRLWDCKPLEDTEIKKTIAAYCRSQGVKFKDIMSWNALNGTLVTAGVIGLVSPFRYLMITPELMNLLDKDEIMGVVSHEVGHVKKRHLLFYLLFFLGFFVLVTGLFGWINILSYFILPIETVNSETVGYIFIFILLIFLVIYIRFVFGYFMRNFERQADTYCFASGVDPNHLVTSFMKLRVHVGDDGKKPNWHHYNISQRIDFLRKCKDNPGEITRHATKLKRSLRVFLTSMIIITAVSFYTPPNLLYQAWEKVFQHRIEQEPDNPRLYAGLGQMSYQFEKWEESKNAYEKSLKLEYQQPEVLNNLAWLYLKCPDETLLNPKRALILAEDAAELSQPPHILDTLAEAYFQNSMYKQAFLASQKALLKANDNISYYKKQLKKMLKYYKKFKTLVTI